MDCSTPAQVFILRQLESETETEVGSLGVAGQLSSFDFFIVLTSLVPCCSLFVAYKEA